MRPLLLAAWAGCFSPSITEIDLSDQTAVAFFVEIEGGAVVGASPAFGLEEGRLSFGTPSMTVDGGSERRLILISHASLDAWMPAWDTSRVSEVEGRAERPPDQPRFRTLTPPFRVELALPPDALLSEPLDGEPVEYGPLLPEIQGGITLVLPLDAEFCAPSLEPLSAFGETDDLQAGLGGSNLGSKITFARLLPDGRAALIMDGAAFLLGQGESLADKRFTSLTGPSEKLPRNVIESGRVGGLKFVSIDYAPHPTALDRLRAVVGMAGWIGASEQGGVLLEMEISPAGFENVRTATVIEQDVGAVLIDGDDVMAAADEGLFMIGTFGGTYRRQRVVSPSGARSLAATGDENHRFISASSGGIFTYRDTRRWERLETFSHSYRTIAADAGDIWVGASNGVILRGSTTFLEEFELSYPPSFIPCASPDSDVNGIRSLNNVNMISLDATHAYVSIASCSAMIAIRRSDLCVSIVTQEGAPISDPGLDPEFVDVLGDRILLSGSGTRVLTTTRN